VGNVGRIRNDQTPGSHPDNARVPDCCSPKGYRQIFSERNAQREARRYRRRGLTSTTRRIADLLIRRGVRDLTVLEVGGGLGALAIELLEAGAERATCVELTPTYERAAAALLREAGLESRVERRVMDFAVAGVDIEAADVVILDRVICCYPDAVTLAGAAAEHARGVLVLSFPNGRWWTRLILRLGNVLLKVMRREFQVFAHRPSLIVATAESAGLRTMRNRPGVFWQVAELVRAT
jgi:2-polyprenyl-3-methyl-5-hydroxy-6-metoxy-1,4-benzoquinol methylase